MHYMKVTTILKLIVLTSFLSLFSACDLFVSSSEKDLDAVDYTDIAYGTYGERNYMDVYLPEGRYYDTPVMIFIHGGYWKTYDKSQMSDYAEDYRDKGYATVCINHRYTGTTVNYEQIMEDVDNAVNYILTNADNWNISDSQFAILGFSSGGISAPLYAYGFDSNDVIKAVVCFSGAFDFTDPDFWIGSTLDTDKVLDFTGASDEDDEDNKYASPVYYLRNVPTLIFHGNSDSIVDISHIENFVETLNNNGIVYNYLEISSGHSMFYGNSTVEEMIDDWMHSYLE